MGKQQEAHEQGRTVFQYQVKNPPHTPRLTSKLRVPLHVLMWGNNRKIGGWMQKGRWKGMPILSLTLEERATCPTTCPVWSACYGDNMQHAWRYRAGPELLSALEADLMALDVAFPAGYLVRLHVLGDFYSTAYVRFWMRMMREHECRIYGYTHRQQGTPIGDLLTQMVLENPERCALMRSDPVHFPEPLPAAIVVPSTATEPAIGTQVICPQETGKTATCATCGLCMNGRTGVSFLNHSSAEVRLKAQARRLEVVQLQRRLREREQEVAPQPLAAVSA